MLAKEKKQVKGRLMRIRKKQANEDVSTFWPAVSYKRGMLIRTLKTYKTRLIAVTGGKYFFFLFLINFLSLSLEKEREN